MPPPKRASAAVEPPRVEPLFGTPTLDDEFDDEVFAPLDGGTLDDATLDGVPPEDLDDSEFEEIPPADESALADDGARNTLADEGARHTLADDEIAYGRESIAEIAPAPLSRDSLSFEDDETHV